MRVDVRGIVLAIACVGSVACSEEQHFGPYSAAFGSAEGLSGAIFTTNASGSRVNQNHFAMKADVFLNGGPHRSGAAGLTDGLYVVGVTNPSGSTLLSPLPLKTVEVIGGEFVELVALAPFADAPDGGKVYKVWATPADEYPSMAIGAKSGFHPPRSRTDNFMVDEAGGDGTGGDTGGNTGGDTGGDTGGQMPTGSCGSFATHYGDTHGDIFGDICGDVYGSMYGDHFGNHYGNRIGDIRGDVFGDHYGDHYGNRVGDRFGDHHGFHDGDVYGDTFGDSGP